MLLDKSIKEILIRKLRFSQEHLNQLEHNKDLLSKTLGLIEMTRKANHHPQIKPYIKEQLNLIRKNLGNAAQAKGHLLKRARADFYTFNS